jgi:hypothetical protein
LLDLELRMGSAINPIAPARILRRFIAWSL